MSVKNMITTKPVRYKTDKNGKRIAVYRAGVRDTNKYARKTARERRDEANMGNDGYNPDDPSTWRKRK